MAGRYEIHPLEKQFIKYSTGVDLDAPPKVTNEEFQRFMGNTPPLGAIEERYKDLLQRLGVQGHSGAVAEIEKLRSALTEQEVWLVLDDEGNPIFCADWPEACHEHINDAISEHDIDGAGQWKVVRAVVTPNN